MRESSPLRIAASFAADVAPWILLSGGFLAIYVSWFGASPGVVVPHLQVVAVLWLCVASLKLAFWGTRPPTRVRRALAALPAALVLAGLLVFYAAALLGLASWRRMINWQLVSTYAAQWQPTLQALDIPAWQPALALACGFGVLWFLTARLWSGERWLQALAARPLLGNGLGFAGAGVLAGGLLLTQAFSVPQALAGEPLAVAMFPAAARNDLQHGRNPAGMAPVDERERAARKQYAPSPSTGRRNVILVVGDALRADRMPWAGYGRELTPYLKQLAERHPSAHVDNMRSVCAESSCGLLALASSRYVHATPAKPFTLHDVLRLHGYRIEMILSGDHTNFYGLRDSYGQVDSYFDGSMQSRHYANDDRLVLDRVAAMPRQGEAPVLIQFHLMSSHGLGKRYPESNDYQPARNYYGRLPLEGSTPRFRAAAANYYDNGILQLDATLRELVPLLEQKGYLQDALLVITGDHGDQLGEHGAYAHANGIWEPALRVPFLMIDFSGRQPVFPSQAITSQIDVAPTILHALGMPVPDTWQGTALQSGGRRSVMFQEGFATGLYEAGTRGQLYKYWRDWRTHKEYVFDVSADPGEERDLATAVGEKQIAHWRRSVLGNLAARGLKPRELALQDE